MTPADPETKDLSACFFGANAINLIYSVYIYNVSLIQRNINVYEKKIKCEKRMVNICTYMQASPKRQAALCAYISLCLLNCFIFLYFVHVLLK